VIVRETLIPHIGRKFSEQDKYESVQMGHLLSRNCHRRDGTLEIKGEMMKETGTISAKL
jgi:hypothetical protein